MLEIKRARRKLAGRVLFTFISNHREKLLEAKNLGTLYVSKLEESKGKKSFNKDEFTEYREIKYMRDKDFRKTCGKFAYSWVQILSKELKDQYGFIPHKGIKDIIRERQNSYRNSKVIYSIDMSNAFGQVSFKQLYFYIRKGLFINARDAKLLANSMCHNGFMYQGHPLSPIFFNFHLNKSLIRLRGLCDDIFAYADDIQLFFKKGLSRKIKNLIHTILEENNLICNKKKSIIKRISSGVRGLGYTFRNNTFRAKNLASLKRLSKYFELKTIRNIIPNKSENKLIFLQKWQGIQNFIKDMETAPFEIGKSKDIKRYYQTVFSF